MGQLGLKCTTCLIKAFANRESPKGTSQGPFYGRDRHIRGGQTCPHTNNRSSCMVMDATRLTRNARHEHSLEDRTKDYRVYSSRASTWPKTYPRSRIVDLGITLNEWKHGSARNSVNIFSPDMLRPSHVWLAPCLQFSHVDGDEVRVVRTSRDRSEVRPRVLLARLP